MTEITFTQVMDLAEEKGYKMTLSGQIAGALPENYAKYSFLELSLLQQWLIEKKCIRLWIENHQSDGFRYRLNDVLNYYESYSTYRQALIEGINEALKLL